LDLSISKYYYSVVDQEFHSSGTAVVLLYGLSVWNVFWRQQVGLGERNLSDRLQARIVILVSVSPMACGRRTLYAVWKQPL
jgi:hypothetical protein